MALRLGADFGFLALGCGLLDLGIMQPSQLRNGPRRSLCLCVVGSPTNLSGSCAGFGL